MMEQIQKIGDFFVLTWLIFAGLVTSRQCTAKQYDTVISSLPE